MSDKEINKPHDQVERKNQGDRASEGTSKDSVISGDRKDHQAMHQEASKAGHTFDTFSDKNHNQSFRAIQPAADTFGIDFGDGTIKTSIGRVAKASGQLIAANLTIDSPNRNILYETIERVIKKTT